MSKVYPVLLAGGSGTRLWPLSRKSYPKQFAKIIGDKTLFQESALRLTSSKSVDFAPHITLTNSDFRFIVCEQLHEVEIDPKHVLIEPEAKNTAPAILAAALYAQLLDPDAVLLVAPSDHVIPDAEEFHKAIRLGLSCVEDDKIVSFGITPTKPETGYGYLKIAHDENALKGAHEVEKFIEKPSSFAAETMLSEGDYLWNAGIFLFKASDMVSAFNSLAPEELRLVTEAVHNSKTDLGFIRLDPEPWASLNDISIDYAVMEKVHNLVAVPYASKWSDLGDWNAVWSEADKDTSLNLTNERAHVIDCDRSILRADGDGQEIVGLGLKDVIAIATPDAVLVAHRDRAQDVKKVVEYLRTRDVTQADTSRKVHRPWGWFESLVLGDRFQVKRIFVKPGASLSLQSHRHRSEHWIVVAGTAKITIDNDTQLLSEGQSVYVPLGVMHRMENPGKINMVLIEVQTGSYLGEDDIIRYDDIYARQ